MITRCLCQNCKGAIEFEAERSGENVNCPHCNWVTRLETPSHKPPPKPPGKMSLFFRALKRSMTPRPPEIRTHSMNADDRYQRYADSVNNAESSVVGVCRFGIFCAIVGALFSGSIESAVVALASTLPCVIIMNVTRAICSIGRAIIESSWIPVMDKARKDDALDHAMRSS